MAFAHTVRPLFQRHARPLAKGASVLGGALTMGVYYRHHHQSVAGSRLNLGGRFVHRIAFAESADSAVSNGSAKRKVVFAFDTTEASQYAFEWALEHFFTSGDVVLLLNVRPNPPQEVEERSGPALWEHQARLQEIERLDRVHYELSEAKGKEYAAACRAKGIQCKPVHAMGNPAVRIVDVGADNDADCIVLGTHDRGALGRLTVGGVPTYVVHNAHCPVVVARPKSQGPVRHESPYYEPPKRLPSWNEKQRQAEDTRRQPDYSATRRRMRTLRDESEDTGYVPRRVKVPLHFNEGGQWREQTKKYVDDTYVTREDGETTTTYGR